MADNAQDTPQSAPTIVDGPDMLTDDHGKVPSVHLSLQSDDAVLATARRKAWVNGVLKNDSFIYFVQATTVSGVVTFPITDDGTATGNAVYANVHTPTVTITPYGNGAVYQVFNIAVAGNKKTITASVNQVTSVLVGLLQSTTAANGITCTMLVLGD